MNRRALMVVHTGRKENLAYGRLVGQRLTEAGFEVRVLAQEAEQLDLGSITRHDTRSADGAEIVLALGGDGTVLRAAECARSSGAPLLGINLGHVGFLAEAEISDLEAAVKAVVDRQYTVESRLTLSAQLQHAGRARDLAWALNEASVEKASRLRMLEVMVSVDNQPLSRWGCDGVVCATPTGSTAYAFSAGGPVVWPDLEALLVVPISAHALFARPLVIAPSSVIRIQVLPESPEAVLNCDGRRTYALAPGDSLVVRRSETGVHLVRLHDTGFTERLVAKFGLPVDGWRAARQS